MAFSKRILLLLFSVFAINGLSGQSENPFSDLTFRSIGPATMSGRVVDLAVVEQDPYTFYVASATGGIWKTTNNGVTYTPLFQNEPVHSIGDIAVHQRDTNIVWVGTGERANRQSSSWGNGVYRSGDGGQTWQHLGLEASHHIGRIVLHSTDTNTVFVAAMGHLWGANEERGLYKTTDGGKSWKAILQIDELTGVVDVAMDPNNPDWLYAASYQRQRKPFGFHGGGPGSALYRSKDGGNTWEKITNGLPDGDFGRIGISIYRKNPNIVYISIEQGLKYNASTAYGKRKAGMYRSDDRGDSWQYMGDWNPRPMYASQPLVDPNDDARVYMMNAYSVSTDSAKTFKRVPQSLHSDDRILWINPKDSRHLIKGDDGGVGISYDRGMTWLFATHLPISQFYRVSVDMQNPYWVYGGLQDNGSWAGPNATYRNAGIINEDWIKTGGGDGFLNLIHPEHSNELYGESQYLGLFKLDLATGERRSIRPGDPKGKIRPRRNWDAWGPGIPEPELGNAMAPANWDGPFCFSPHDPNTIYAGTNKLWRSTDGGDAWEALGDLTTGVNRRELTIMEQRPDTLTLSLDDGIPYYPTLTSIAESPLKPGVLYVGTDDGNLQISNDGGNAWSEVSGRLPGLPKSTWISGIEPSRFNAGTVYVAVNNYRNDDFGNYVYRSDDFGATWKLIVAGLPTDRVARTIREDTKNPDLLYLGTELGLFISFDRGDQWQALQGNLPTIAVNDLVIHPRDNDLVIGTHGRGIWILDNLSVLQSYKNLVGENELALFPIADTEMIRYRRERGHTGDMIFKGENPPDGAILRYNLAKDVAKSKIKFEIYAQNGELINTIQRADTSAGVHSVIWDLRHKRLAARPSPNSNNRRNRRGQRGPFVDPGVYKVVLTADDQQASQLLRVLPDPRSEVPVTERKSWKNHLNQIIVLHDENAAQLKKVYTLHNQMKKYREDVEKIYAAYEADLEELNRMSTELFSRIGSLYREVEGWIGKPTEDQLSQFVYFEEKHQALGAKLNYYITEVVPQFNKKLKRNKHIEIEP